VSTGQSNIAEVELLSPLTIRNISANREVLLNSLRDGAPISIRIPEDAGVDLCGVQLIESARRQASEAGVEIALAQPASDAVRAVLTGAGFLPTASEDDARFWLHQGTQ
jgi:hypothetical protein